MLRRSFIIALFILMVAATALAKDTREELRVSLRFTATENLPDEAPEGRSKLQNDAINLVVTDGRRVDSPSDLGEGTNDDDLTFPIRATNEVLPFVTDSLERIARAWGLKVDESAGRKLELTLDRFNVEESNKAVGSVFRAEVELGYALKDAGGKTLLKGTIPGDATRYGRARSADNANEVMSDALVEAFADLLSDSELQNAWTKGR